MSSIDRRVVELEFDNKQFEAGIKDTLNSLEALKKGLTLEGATKGLTELENAGKRFSLEGMSSALDNISSKFSVMGAVGFAVIQRLTNAAIDLGKKITGAVLDPLIAGGKRRALNLEQAHFMFEGLGMDAEAVMDNALEAVLGTAFGLDEAAKAASQFGASGMQAGEEMTSALRAISGTAAMTNSSYEDMSQVFTKVAGNGRLMGDDLLRLSARGLNAAATLGEAFGKTEAEIRELVTKGEISFEMFYTAMDQAFGEQATKANETYTGSLANLRAALSRIGASFFTPWLTQQRDLFNALTPAIDDVGDALKPLIEIFTHFTGVGTQNFIKFIESIDFTKLSLGVGPFFGIVRNTFLAINSFLKPIRDAFRQIFPARSMEQVKEALQAIERFVDSLILSEESGDKLRRTFAGLFAVLGIGWEIVKAGASFLLDLFGIATEGSIGFLDATANIGDFLVAMHTAIKEGEGLTNFFKTLGNIIKGPLEFLKELASAFLSLFAFDAPDAEGLSRIFEPLHSSADVLERVGNAIQRSWQRVGSVLKRVADVFRPLAREVGAFFGTLGTALVESLKDLNFDRVLDIINTTFLGGLLVTFRRISRNFSSTAGSSISRLTAPFYNLTLTLKRMQATLQAMTLLQIAAAVGVLTASVVALSKVDAAGLTRALSALTVMFTQLFAAMAVLAKIGGVKGLFVLGAGLVVFGAGIRVLVSSVRSLSKMDWDELARGLAALAGVLAMVVATTRGLAGASKGMITAGAGLLILSFAIKVLASAVGDLAELDWEEMARGLVGVGTLLGSLAIFTKLAAANKGAVAQGAGLILLATGIKILASAVSYFAELSWESVGKGLASVSAILAAFVIFSRTMGNPAGIVRAGVALVLIGAAMNVMAAAMAKFAELSWTEIAKGLASVAGALVIIVGALALMPPHTVASAAALIGVSVALGLIANAVKKMGGMTWEEIAKGLVTLAGSLGIIAVAMMGMTAALPGAAALLVISAALAVLAPVLILLGSMSWESIAKSLIMLAGAFVVFGLAGVVLAPVVPVLLGLGAAVALLGVGLLAAGAGLLAFSIALTALAAAGAAGVAAIVAIVEGLIGLLPFLFKTLGEAIIEILKVFIEAAPVILEAVTVLVQSMVAAIRDNLPDILDLVQEMTLKFLDILVDITPDLANAALTIMIDILEAMNSKVPDIVDLFLKLMIAVLGEIEKKTSDMVSAGIAIMIAFLGGIEDNVGKVVTAGTDIIIALIRGISENMVRIADEGMQAVIAFINGLSDAIDRHSGALQAAGRRLAFSVVDGMTGGLASKVNEVAGQARALASNAVSAVRGIFATQSPSKVFMAIGRDVGDGLVIGLKRSGRVVNRAASRFGDDAIDAMMKSIVDLSDLFGDDIDLTPTITPVLDLDEFRRDARQIGRTLSEQMSVDSAYSKAKDVSHRHRANEAARREEAPDREVSDVAQFIYNQYNTSPKALSSADIYRQTKNQLSTARGALTP